jgi:Domain of unknown function (DUF4157)
MFSKATQPQQAQTAKPTTSFFKPEPMVKSLATEQQATTERAPESVMRSPIAPATSARFQTSPTLNPPSNVKFQTSNLPIQAKLTVGQPNDKYEQEADAMADKVVQRWAMPNAVAALPTITPFNINAAQRACAACEKEDHDHIQRKESGEMTASPSVESRLSATKGGGNSLPESTRTHMESAIGADFSNVRVHTGGEAVQLSQDLSAHAFTHGSDVYFNSGKFAPNTEGGRHLLAHELVHTVQQGSAGKNIQRAPAHLIDANTAEDTEDNVTYIVKRTKRFSTEKRPETAFDFDTHADKDNVSITFTLCRGNTKGSVELGANIPEAAKETAQKVVDAVLSGGNVGDVLKQAEVTPFIEFVLTQSKAFKLTIGGNITVSSEGVSKGGGSLGLDTQLGRLSVEGSGGKEGWDASLKFTVPLGSAPEKIDCTKTKGFIHSTFTCEKLNPDHDVEKEREKKTTDAPLVTFLFRHAKFNINIPENKLTLAHVQSLLGDGYRVTKITGFTSPEGPLEKKKGNDFEGNIALANERAAATLSAIEKMCATDALSMRPKCVDNALTNIEPMGEGELYSLPDDKDGLDTEAYIAAEVKDETEANALRKMTPKQQERRVFPKLRRTVVAFEKITTSTEKYTEKEKTPNTQLEECPTEVLKEAKKVFK